MEEEEEETVQADKGKQPLVERLRSRRWRLTAQRRAVAQVLSGANLHLTAEETFRRARSILPEISRATVYNTLGELVDMGELQEVQIKPGPTQYDPNARVPHHHLVCSECGAIYDIQPRGVDQLELDPAEGEGFSLEQVEVVFRGRCASCRQSRS